MLNSALSAVGIEVSFRSIIATLAGLGLYILLDVEVNDGTGEVSTSFSDSRVGETGTAISCVSFESDGANNFWDNINKRQITGRYARPRLTSSGSCNC